MTMLAPPNWSHVLEAVFRCSPEIVCCVGFFVRRRIVDTRFAETLLREFNAPQLEIDDQRALLLDHVEWDSLKRDIEAAFLTCGFSYVVLAFVVDKTWVGVGFGLWIIATALLRLIIWREEMAYRFTARKLLIWSFVFVLSLSVLAKLATVFLREAIPAVK